MGLPLGTPYSQTATRAMLLGSGELGKEVAIELQRYGVEVRAVDRYSDAPAMQVAHSSATVNMLDREELLHAISEFSPHVLIPEIEAIATDVLLELESDSLRVTPTAKAAHMTMNREHIRRLAAEELKLPTSPYEFVKTKESYLDAVGRIGISCVIKPVMSSSGKGQSLVKTPADVERAWDYALAGTRGSADSVIVEGFVDFDYEITLLTVRHVGGTTFCAPIGHRQRGGDYFESWQPQPMSDHALREAQAIAEKVTEALGGWGIFGVELFIKGNDVIFSEVSPRPHDTGLVTLKSQELSEFALHARALLGLPVSEEHTTCRQAAASRAIVAMGNTTSLQFDNVAEVLSDPCVELRFFGKPEVNGTRRVGVVLATGDDALATARQAHNSLRISDTQGSQPSLV